LKKLKSRRQTDDEDDLPVPYFETEDQSDRFLNAARNWTRTLNGSGKAKTQESPYYDLYYVAIMTGLRKGELKGLNEEDIDWQEGVITVKRQWVTKLKEFGPTKSRKYRYIKFDLGGSLAESLRRAIVRTRSIQASQKVINLKIDRGAVFTSSNGKRIIGDSFCAGHFNVLLKQAGLNPEITFHGLRRTFANRYYRLVGKISEVQEVLGHTEEATTRIYLNINKKTLSTCVG
jgi:integrase